MVVGVLVAALLGCHGPNPDYDPAASWLGSGGSGGKPRETAPRGTMLQADAGPLLQQAPMAAADADGPADPGASPDASTTAPAIDAGGVEDSGVAAPGRADGSVAVPFQGDLKKGLTLYLAMEDNAGTGVAADGSGKKSLATMKNLNATVASTSGRLGKALALRGDSWNGWLDVAGEALLRAVSQPFSIALWVWRTETGGTFVSRRTFGARGFLFTFGLEGSGLSAQLNTTAAYKFRLDSSVPVPAERWSHVAMTYDLHEVRLYVDGLLVAAAPYQQAIPLDTTSYIVGGLEQQDRSVAARFPGKIDELVLYTRVLSAAELGALASGLRPLGQ